MAEDLTAFGIREEDRLDESETSKEGQSKTRGAKKRHTISSVLSSNAEILKETIPLWTERWTPEYLEELRNRLGAREFDRGYRQLAISDEDLHWQPEWVDGCLDRKMTAPASLLKGSLFEGMTRHGGVDLSVAEAQVEGSFFVAMVVAIDADHHRWVLAIERSRGMSFGEQVNVIVDMQKRFLCHAISVESVGYQNAITRHLTSQTAVPAVPFYTSSTHKRDLIVGIPSLATEFEQGRWHLPYGDARSKRMVDPFIEEMRVYPLSGFHDDCIMAAYFARESARMEKRIQPRISILRF
jgi:hypothetical protein